MLFSVRSSFVVSLLLVLPFFTLFSASCTGQPGSHHKIAQATPAAAPACDGCELLFAGMPEQIDAVDTSKGWQGASQQLILSGTVFDREGIRPVPGVIIYYWQTDETGYYAGGEGMHPAARQHGRLRGWVKSDENGQYKIFTCRPAPYPGEKIPAHIHLFILEPGAQHPYYVDDLVFDDDPLLLPYIKKYPLENRGGNGVLRVLLDGKKQVAEHDIMLGLHIPGYPQKSASGLNSGLSVGEDQPSFQPYHAYGPDKGTRTCPVCKYGRYHGLLLFVGSRPDWPKIREWLLFMEKESAKRQQYLKAYFIYANAKGYSKNKRAAELQQLGQELGLRYLALTYAPSLDDRETELYLNQLNEKAESTLIIYRYRKIVAKFINLQPGAENFARVSACLDKTKGAYFALPAPEHE